MVKTAVVVLVGMLCGMLQDQVDNVMYKTWSKCKAGASVKLSIVSEAAGNKTEMTMTSKLVSIDKDKAVVETATSMMVGGQKMDQPATKTEIPAKVKKVEPAKDAVKPKEGDEEVEAAGKKYKCHWTETVTVMLAIARWRGWI